MEIWNNLNKTVTGYVGACRLGNDYYNTIFKMSLETWKCMDYIENILWTNIYMYIDL